MTQTAAAIDAVLAEHADLERQLSDPQLHDDVVNARRVGKRSPSWPRSSPRTKARIGTRRSRSRRELALDDASFAAEVPELEPRSPSSTRHSPTCWPT